LLSLCLLRNLKSFELVALLRWIIFDLKFTSQSHLSDWALFEVLWCKNYRLLCSIRIIARCSRESFSGTKSMIYLNIATSSVLSLWEDADSDAYSFMVWIQDGWPSFLGWIHTVCWWISDWVKSSEIKSLSQAIFKLISIFGFKIAEFLLFVFEKRGSWM